MNAAELSAVIAKIVAYETAPAGGWTQAALLAADKPDEGGDFPLDAAALASALTGTLKTRQLSLLDVPLADGRAQVVQAFRDGTCFLNWTGHGGMDRLSKSGLLTSADVPALPTVSGTLPVLVAASCVINRFEVPGIDSLGERLVLKADGGAVAAWAPSSLAYNADSALLNRRFYEAVYGRRLPRLGDAVPRYDPSIDGLPLLSVQFIFSSTVTGDIAVVNLANVEAQTVTAVFGATAVLQRPDTSTVTTAAPSLTRDVELPAGLSTTSVTGLSATATGSHVSPEPAGDLTLFSYTGGGTVTLTVTAAGSNQPGVVITHWEKTSGESTVADTLLTNNLRVIYYTPEPAALALAGMALVAGFCRRSRRTA